MDKLILQDVRCFRGRHELPLAPLTILVGENSTGKSTVLSAARLAWDIGNGVASPDFNEEPFDWGAYDQIAYTGGGRSGRAKTFVIGFEASPPAGVAFEDGRTVRVEASFEERDAQPRGTKWHVSTGPYSIVVDGTDDKAAVITVNNGEGIRELRREWESAYAGQFDFRDLAIAAVHSSKMASDDEGLRLRAMLYQLLEREPPYAFAPIRTRPRRTYDPRPDMPGPEGEHVLMVLAKLRSSSPMEWGELTRDLSRFGAQSGLFKSVNVKPLGALSDPFQVQITVNGAPSNLIDVGYGVSQVLPILVECLGGQPRRMFLMQQPEVHLHPKAQAQIGSLLGYLAVKHKKQFLVETHSDYLVDRVRIDVQDGKFGLQPKDVRILYFERKGAKVVVHAMHLDECGNLIGVPSGYRRFFLEEEKRLLGG